MKKFSACRQEKRAYNVVVFELKKEIPVRMLGRNWLENDIAEMK
jgi:hypothetical protein